MAGGHGLHPDGVQFGIIGNRIGLHKAGVGLVDKPLAELAVPEPCPMAYQFVREGAADARDDQAEHGMFEYGAVADLQDMLDIGMVSAWSGLGE